MRYVRHRAAVIATQVDVLPWADAIEKISGWAHARESRYVTFSNVHSTVTAAFDTRFNLALNASDLCTADGAPIAWMLRQLGARGQPRINGPELMWRLLAHEDQRGGKVYFYGGTPEALKDLVARVRASFPGLDVVGSHAPPFRRPTSREDEDDVERINASGAQIVFVGLGCPKQETWMAAHRGRVQAVMLGVGAAFDFHAGHKMRAPVWMQSAGLEWLHRLTQEPHRLWRRYLFTNLPFVAMALAQWFGSRVTGARPAASPPAPPVTSVDAFAESRPQVVREAQHTRLPS